MSSLTPISNARPKPYVKIINQPSSVYRMRYKAEKRMTCLLAETNETIDNKQSNHSTATSRNKRKNNQNTSNCENSSIYPRIEIVNGCGPATLIVSCVNKCEPYHVHPHRLIGDNCKSGVAMINIGKNETFFDLTKVCIEFTKKSDIDESINELKQKNVDPFNVGFNFDRNKIDLTQLRLCFQVYLRDPNDEKIIIRDSYHILEPVVSNIICNTSRKSSLSIVQTYYLHSSAEGGQNVILLIKKLEKDQKPLHVKFYDDSGWHKVVELTEHNLHYQNTIHFTAPAYKNLLIENDVNVSLKLYVPFSNEREKTEFIKQLNADENGGEDEDEVREVEMSLDSNDFYHGNIPDGKYESKVIDFVYKPKQIKNLKRKLNVADFYEIHDLNEKDVPNDINSSVKQKLAKRNLECLSSNFDEIKNVPYKLLEIIPNDPPLINNILVYQKDNNYDAGYSSENMINKLVGELKENNQPELELDVQLEPFSSFDEIKNSIENEINTLKSNSNNLLFRHDSEETTNLNDFYNLLNSNENNNSDQISFEQLFNFF